MLGLIKVEAVLRYPNCACGLVVFGGRVAASVRANKNIYVGYLRLRGWLPIV